MEDKDEEEDGEAEEKEEEEEEEEKVEDLVVVSPNSVQPARLDQLVGEARLPGLVMRW